MNALIRVVRSVPSVTVLMAVFLVLAGCRPPFESRYDALPGPVSTADLVAASLEEPVALTAEEWALTDLVMDSYLGSWSDLSNATIAPLVRDARGDKSNRWLADDSAVNALARRTQSVLGKIRSQDETLFSELAVALPNRTTWVERARTRRSIDRSLKVIAGRDDKGTGMGFLDLDVEVGALLSHPSLADRAVALRATLEPMRAAYRYELSVAAQSLADALLDFPSDRLKAIRQAGVSDQAAEAYVRGAGQSGSPEEHETLMAAVRLSQAKLRKAITAIDDLNARTAEAWNASLPADAAETLRSETVFRRVQAEGIQPIMRWYVEVLELLPDVRDGRTPKTAAALKLMRSATDEYAKLTLRVWKDPSEGAALAERIAKANDAVQTSLQDARKAAEEELSADTLEKTRSLLGATQVEARGILDQLVGRANASRLLARAPHAMFNPDPPQEDMDKGKSLALQVLLGPMATRGDLETLAQAFGAGLADPVMDELWQRYNERAEVLTRVQDEALLIQEKLATDRGQEAGNDPAAFEREIASYLRMILAADEERGRLMNDMLGDMAAARGLASDDARVVVARAQLAVARSAVPWRRFQLPWLVGPLWLTQADILALISSVTPGDPMSQAAVLAVAVDHAPAIQQAALNARMAGFEALRDFVMLMLKLQREGAQTQLSPDEIPTLPASLALARRVRDAATARAEAQLALMTALEPVLGPARTAILRSNYAAQTFPEFFAERPWHTDAQALSDAAADTRPPPGSPNARVAAAAARWREQDAELIGRLLRWQRSADAVAPPMRALDLATLSQEDAELAALRVLRDESALRLLRDAALAQGHPPNVRMPGVLRSVSRPTLRLSE